MYEGTKDKIPDQEFISSEGVKRRTTVEVRGETYQLRKNSYSLPIVSAKSDDTSASKYSSFNPFLKGQKGDMQM